MGGDPRWRGSGDTTLRTPSTRRLAEQLQVALETRGVVDRAIGIMMSRSGGTEADAMNRLRELSQAEHRRLAAVARNILDEAVRRANARHRPGSDH